MRYKISGKQIDIGESLQTHVEMEVSDILNKYAERPTDALITFSKESHEFVCETAIHLSTGITVNSKAKEHDIYVSFDKSAKRVETQLRRYKRRLKEMQIFVQHPLNPSRLRRISSPQNAIMMLIQKLKL